MSQPFEGINVIEFGQFVAVPVASQLLADGGAYVIKVETLEGDPIRMAAPLAPGESRYYITRNNGKHSLPLALSNAAAKPVIEALVAKADVVLMNLRPGLPEKLGLDPQQLLKRHPSIIVGSVSGFGLEGPEAGDAGMDLVVQARSGLMAANGRIVDERPAAGDPVSADMMCAMTLAFGVSSALLRRERTGKGGILDTSLMQAAMLLTSSQLVRAEARDKGPHEEMLNKLDELRSTGAAYADQLDLMRPKGRAFMFTVYYRTFVTEDSHIAVACGSHGLRVKFGAALGFEDEGLSPAFSGHLETHYEALAQHVESLVAGQPSDFWVDKLRTAGVPVSKVRLPVELYDDEQIDANGFLRRFEHPTAGAMTVVAPPLRLDEAGFVPGEPTPAFGSETQQILTELGFSSDEIGELLSVGATHDGLGSKI
ncbi:MAG: crotonobetainyl-CoA:carnitine CoA-transferase CaiB-like acyl-CoA transferase [Limisphaerales bacterium]